MLSNLARNSSNVNVCKILVAFDSVQSVISERAARKLVGVETNQAQIGRIRYSEVDAQGRPSWDSTLRLWEDMLVLRIGEFRSRTPGNYSSRRQILNSLLIYTYINISNKSARIKLTSAYLLRNRILTS
ncbi:unnamed protein product [Ceratitis capitata]|uniref:(Mediterranean fruit fly) hypothetical protein n=1 Tax=Ceratitis capitata TaxID=7213 RepID=A0A811UR45_CERCA|nr:unnamed protein product [Ceratitis capitata]